MGYLDSSDAALIALTRERRAERAAAAAAARPETARFSAVVQVIDIWTPPPESPPPGGWPKPERWKTEFVPTGRRRKRQATAWRRAKWDMGVRDCCYCAVRMTWKPGRLNTATTEHRVPLCLDGADDESNWAVSCSRCNEAKGALREEEFLAVRGGTAFPVPWS